MGFDFSNDSVFKNQLANDNHQALVYLMDTYHKPLCLYVHSLSNNHELTQDIVQNVFIKIWEDRRRIHSIKHVKSFLYKSVYNGLLNESRKDKRMLSIEEHHLQALDEIMENENDVFLQKQIKLIHLEIQKLPERCKATFLLSKQDGLTNMEIADFMNVSTRTVEAQMNKAYNILREKLKDKIKPILFFLLGIKTTLKYNSTLNKCDVL